METKRKPNARILFCDPANPEHLSMRCEQIVTDRIKISTALPQIAVIAGGVLSALPRR